MTGAGYTSRDEMTPMRERSLWLSLTAGPLLWALHLNVAYALSSLACERDILGLASGSIAGFTALQAVEVGLAVLFAALIAAAGVAGWRSWRALRAQTGGEPDARRQTFMAFLAVLLNVIFFATVILALAPVLFLQPCGFYAPSAT